MNEDIISNQKFQSRFSNGDVINQSIEENGIASSYQILLKNTLWNLQLQKDLLVKVFKIVDNIEYKLFEGNLPEFLDYMNSDYSEQILVESIFNEEKNNSKTFIELKSFRKSWEANNLTDEDLRELQNRIMNGDPSITSLGGNVYKIRFIPSRFNRGKNAQFRPFYVEIIKKDTIYLIDVLNKKDESNISDDELAVFKRVAKKLETEV